MTLSIKARAIWVLGIYIYIYSAFPRARSASSVFALYSGSNAGQAWPRQRRQNVTKTEPNAQLKIFNITPFQYTWCKALRCFFQTKAVFFWIVDSHGNLVQTLVKEQGFYDVLRLQPKSTEILPQLFANSLATCQAYAESKLSGSGGAAGGGVCPPRRAVCSLPSSFTFHVGKWNVEIRII